ncbi:class I SAM-dependent methyltransferase [Azotobacter chroococcum]|uniref:Methyltransferase family protein n=3 Tax=Azotobacter chroococcum TaxID=353 RepID=A0A4R1NS17_9GAMM|nr:class I SAM-dependent methyltransferase [Azotobacter chroococcum]TBV91009.1 class I SAM-dependent methyltransferase [Azotobacter chroococcum]TCL15184.1 methyltransferase family protein [Azotobacter chroococcum]
MTAAEMRIQAPEVAETIDEAELYLRLLPLASARIIELGCGAAAHTRTIAEKGKPASILACEVDTLQLEKNLAIGDLPTVTFRHAGAQAIPAEDGSADLVMMFKSLHHVPVSDMDDAIREIRRVLRPGGLAYISEPVYSYCVIRNRGEYSRFNSWLDSGFTRERITDGTALRSLPRSSVRLPGPRGPA